MSDAGDGSEYLRLSIICAAEAHAKQLDKSGVHYIYHPLRVMLAVRHLGIDYACCGVLHDVVEDTPVTLRYLTELDVHTVAMRSVSIYCDTGECVYDERSSKK